MSVFRLLNHKALLDPNLKALFVRAFRNERVKVDVEAAWPDFDNMVRRSDRYGLFLGEEKGAFKGLAIVCLPESRIFPVPDYMVFYCDGGHKMALSLGQACVDFIKAAGYNRAMAVNVSGASDPVWLRAFKTGGTWRKVGSLMECELK